MADKVDFQKGVRKITIKNTLPKDNVIYGYEADILGLTNSQAQSSNNIKDKC